MGLIFLYIIASLFVAGGRLLNIFSIDNTTQNQSTQIIFVINNTLPSGIMALFPYNVNIFAMVETVALLLLGILLLGVLKEEQGITILPFEDNLNEKGTNSNAISEMLIVELSNILNIHGVSLNVNLVGNLRSITPNTSLREKVILPPFPIEGESLNKNLEALGNFGLGSASIPLGNILVLIRQICPFTDPGLIISGCLQKYESDICLVAHIKWKNSAWSIHQKMSDRQKISYNDIYGLIRDISFNVLYELEQSNLCNRARLQIFGNGTDKNDLSRIWPNTWIVFKEYTIAVEHLQKFISTNNKKELEQSKDFALKAVSSDPYYERPLDLLLNVGIAYLNLGEKNKAEKLSRYIVSLRPDLPVAWYSWGLVLRVMRLDKEAIECFDKILNSCSFAKKIDRDIYVLANIMKAVSLRRLKRFDEALYYFKKSLYMDKLNGFAWGHYGLTLEAKLDDAERKSNDANAIQKDPSVIEARNEVLAAYLKAVKYFPEFVSVHSALARIYSEKKW